MESFEKTPQLKSEILPRNDEQLPQPIPEQRDGALTSKIKESFGVAKERFVFLAKYRRLKIKEYFGKLNEEELDELLDTDFQNQLQDNPPVIKDVFSPKTELEKIRRLPKDDKKGALDKFKENLATQREALANCRIFIERCIEFNHDVPREKLVSLVDRFSTQYGFSEEQERIVERLIDGYYANRQRVLEIRERFPDDISLVRELSNAEFDNTAKFDVSTGPMSVDITTDGFNAGRILQRSKDAVLKLQDGGFAAKSQHEQPIPYIVINSNFRIGWLRRGDIPLHEHEHLKNMLFREIFDKQINPSEEDLLLSQYESEQDPKLKEGLLESYFRLTRQEAFQDAKDEVLAMKKERSPYSSYDFFFTKDGSPYDYLAYVRDWKEKKDDPLWQTTAERVLVDDYRKVIEDAISAFDRLAREGGYTRDEIIAMFVDKPLPEWPKTAKRLLEHKMKN